MCLDRMFLGMENVLQKGRKLCIKQILVMLGRITWLEILKKEFQEGQEFLKSETLKETSQMIPRRRENGRS